MCTRLTSSSTCCARWRSFILHEEELRANWLLSSQHQRLQWVGGDDWLTQVYACSEVERNRARADYVGEVKRLAAEKQYTLVMDTVTLSAAAAE
eukprot:m.21494 g.21494  ORF g.21494 m.21494 type:complete len:94 (-) comp10723_c0_seq1:787-1068(-)